MRLIVTLAALLGLTLAAEAAAAQWDPQTPGEPEAEIVLAPQDDWREPMVARAEALSAAMDQLLQIAALIGVEPYVLRAGQRLVQSVDTFARRVARARSERALARQLAGLERRYGRYEDRIEASSGGPADAEIGLFSAFATSFGDLFQPRAEPSQAW